MKTKNRLIEIFWLTFLFGFARSPLSCKGESSFLGNLTNENCSLSLLCKGRSVFFLTS